MNFEFLIEMAWKSALISGAALALATLLGRRSAGERAALLGTAAALIVALPVIALLLPALPVVTSTVQDAPADYAALMAAAGPAPAPGMLDDPTPLLELAWAAGALALLLRLAAGLLTLRRWTKSGSEIACPAWREALAKGLDETGCRQDVALLVADVPSPMSWGALRPVILIDPDTARDPGEAAAVVAHELAHVLRGDWVVLILARLAVALFWFNPLMWLLDRRIRVEAEEAADARALEHVEPARYAQTLLSCAQGHAAARLPASAMADTSLARRVRAILERRLKAGAPDVRWVRAAALLVALVAAPIAALKPVQAIVRGNAPAAPAVPEAPITPTTPAAPAAPMALALAAAAPEAPPLPPRPPRAPRAPEGIDGDEIARSVEEAVAESREAREEAVHEAMPAREEALREAGHIDREAIRQAGAAAAEAGRRAAEETRRGLAAGADGMARGAEGMERGARQMEAEADRLRSADYRRQKIAEAAARGRTMTEQQLLEAIPKLHDGARGMRAGADRMRREAERMRSGRG
jgi:beta-lactamase regulating signal transducer with metallopeptidase domain